MTTYEILSLLASLAGSIGVVVSLWFINRQTRVFNSQLMESITQRLTDYSLEISRLFLVHPELRPYFFEGKEIAEDHPDYLQAEAIAEVILDIFWTMATQARRINGNYVNPNNGASAWEIYVGDCFASSPLLTNFLRRRGDWYGEEMIQRMERGIARSQQRQQKKLAQPTAEKQPA